MSEKKKGDLYDDSPQLAENLNPSKSKVRKIFVSAVILLLLLASIGLASLNWLREEDSTEKEKVGENPLSDNYMIFVDEPKTDEEMALVYALSSLTVRGEDYFPLYILGETGLDEHQLWTISHSVNKDAEKYLFTNGAALTVEQQLRAKGIEPNLVVFNFTKEDVNSVLRGFLKNPGPYQFENEIRVASHHEALWVSPLAAIKNAIITVGDEPTYRSQEDVWKELAKLGQPADYILAANPDDYLGDDVFFSIFNGERTSYHYPTLSAVAAEIAAFRKAYVVTQIPDLEEIEIPVEYTALFPEGNPENRNLYDDLNDMFLNNVKAYGYLEIFRYINKEYGPTKYICLVGDAEALPQFELFDYSYSEGNLVEPKIPEYTSSDSAFGFLDPERLDYMTAAVGRIVNFNVQGASNLVARTLGYHYILKEREVKGYVGRDTINWERHSSSWNGYEVADLRLQNTPAIYFCEDSIDEGYDTSYWSTLGPGGGYTSDGGATANMGIIPELEASGLVAYRGHGSWRGCFYTWGRWVEKNFGVGDQLANHVEGEELRSVFLPPQLGCLVSCENAKIHGTNYKSIPIERDKAWAPNYLYAGALGLCAATEVSYSNIGQDLWSAPGQGTGDSKWDINDLWYAAFWDGIFNGAWENGEHTGPEVSGAEAVRLAENRYIENLKKNFDGKYCTPFLAPPEGMIHPERGAVYGEEGGMHWKEVSMFAYYGEPMFRIPVFAPGVNQVDPWH